MAVTVTRVNNPHVRTQSYEIIATADADVTAVITPGWTLTAQEQANLMISLTPLMTKAYVSLWFVAAVAATTITLTKANVMSSGDAAAQLRVDLLLPHSIIA